ncbi:MAG TPA: Crp/Fnr family transcriptional regulator [Candidatus Dormibacteraeota bacterium]|nr:Crp/Fnr family transcriptional regulator [Candidatus Dormibacteraeota bacterium]
MTTTPAPWILRLLREGAWFKQLPDALQVEFVRRSVVRSYRRGQVVTRAGSRVDGLYGLLEGRLQVIRPVGSGVEDLIHVGEPGFWIGEYSVLTGAPAVVSTVASTHARVLILPRREFEHLVDQEPRWYRPFATLALERYALLVRQLADTRSLSPEDRLRSRLADLVELRRAERFGIGPVVLRLSQEELARMVGVSRQTLNVLLAVLRAERLVEVGFRSLRIPDPARLLSAAPPPVLAPRRVS